MAIVGSGAAGLYTALSFPSDWNVLLVTKELLPTSSSSWAQGGIAAVTEPDDSPELHAADTVRAGAGLCEPDAVNVLVREASDRIEELLRWGVEFDRAQQQGVTAPSLPAGQLPYRLAVTLEAAHSRRRVLHVADATGKALVQRLLARTIEAENITVWEQAQVVDLWMADVGDGAGRRCCGFYGLRWDDTRQAATAFCVRAGATVLATGGAGQLYTHTTNPAPSTGDGQAIAWRAGAALRDLEFFQFHPTALMAADAPRFLISEAVRGEGAHLVDADGRRFAFDYHPDGELAPRDVVSRAIFRHLQQRSPGQPNWVWLDMRHLEPETIRHRFPTIAAVCKRYGIDVYTQLVPVAPAAHYWMGGVATDLWGHTTVPDLYAVGEVASTGVHGANRLASNSLLECLVFAHRLAVAIQQSDARGERASRPVKVPLAEIGLNVAEPEERAQDLAELMWDAAGICRTAKRLQSACDDFRSWGESGDAVLSLSEDTANRTLNCSTLYRALELRNLVAIAQLVLKSTAFRCESRGGHFREDCPETDDAWHVHTRIVGNSLKRSPLNQGGGNASVSPQQASKRSQTL